MSDKKLVCSVTFANIKKIDEEAYGVTKRHGWVKFQVGDQTHTIWAPDSEIGKLDPLFELEHTFDITDEKDLPLKATFGMADKQIGDTHDYVASTIKKDQWTPKGMAVPGGSVSLQFKALGWGKVEEEADDDTWMM